MVHIKGDSGAQGLMGVWESSMTILEVKKVPGVRSK